MAHLLPEGVTGCSSVLAGLLCSCHAALQAVPAGHSLFKLLLHHLQHTTRTLFETCTC